MFVMGNLLTALANLLGGVINLWSFVIVVAAILSWLPIDPYHPAANVVRRIADILCDPIRRIVPMHSLGIDLSPLFAILLLQFTNQFLVSSLRELGARMG
jgi:YggT family protein